VALLLAFAPAARASQLGVVEVLHGKSAVASWGLGPLAYPEDGSALEVQSATAGGDRIELHGVSLLQGRITAERIALHPSRPSLDWIDGLVVNGVSVRPTPNRIVPLGGRDYLVVLQQAAVLGQHEVGVVGLRVVLGDLNYAIPAGTQFLVGVSQALRAPAPTPAAAYRPPPSAEASVLGLTALPARPVGVAPISEPLGPGGSSVGARAVLLAEQFLGVPYRWAGADPTGFDCSGLVMYVYGKLGIHLTHFSGAQYHEGVPVPRDVLAPGDLVFFDQGPLGPGHVGIYAGGGEFIQAPHTGDVVKISSLSDASYALRYVGAVRPTG
jgi:cell wall-associated NlpC family hydrolase